MLGAALLGFRGLTCYAQTVRIGYEKASYYLIFESLFLGSHYFSLIDFAYLSRYLEGACRETVHRPV